MRRLSWERRLSAGIRPPPPRRVHVRNTKINRHLFAPLSAATLRTALLALPLSVAADAVLPTPVETVSPDAAPVAERALVLAPLVVTAAGTYSNIHERRRLWISATYAF